MENGSHVYDLGDLTEPQFRMVVESLLDHLKLEVKFYNNENTNDNDVLVVQPR